jgi:hypothetical protein
MDVTGRLRRPSSPILMDMEKNGIAIIARYETGVLSYSKNGSLWVLQKIQGVNPLQLSPGTKLSSPAGFRLLTRERIPSGKGLLQVISNGQENPTRNKQLDLYCFITSERNLLSDSYKVKNHGIATGVAMALSSPFSIFFVHLFFIKYSVFRILSSLTFYSYHNLQFAVWYC